LVVPVHDHCLGVARTDFTVSRGEKIRREGARDVHDQGTCAERLAANGVPADAANLVAPRIALRAGYIDVAASPTSGRGVFAKQITVTAADRAELEIGLELDSVRNEKLDDGAVTGDYRRPEFTVILVVLGGEGALIVVVILAHDMERRPRR
jgi:hypothetical protein